MVEEEEEVGGEEEEIVASIVGVSVEGVTVFAKGEVGEYVGRKDGREENNEGMGGCCVDSPPSSSSSSNKSNLAFIRILLTIGIGIGRCSKHSKQ